VIIYSTTCRINRLVAQIILFGCYTLDR